MEKLKIYQIGIDLAVQIYQLINQHNSLRTDYALNDQLKRAALSVVANIAEGFSRSLNQNRNYLAISSGSANEVVALLQIVERVYSESTADLVTRYKLLGKQINAFSRSLR